MILYIWDQCVILFLTNLFILYFYEYMRKSLALIKMSTMLHLSVYIIYAIALIWECILDFCEFWQNHICCFSMLWIWICCNLFILFIYMFKKKKTNTRKSYKVQELNVSYPRLHFLLWLKHMAYSFFMSALLTLSENMNCSIKLLVFS